MGKEFLHRLGKAAMILGIFSIICGCATVPSEQEIYIGEGFQSFLPKAGSRVVVWGNDSGVVTRTLGWLNDHQIIAIDRTWIEKELTDSGFAHRARREKREKVLAAADSVGASLVLFANVEDIQLGRKFDFGSFRYKRINMLGVGIRGVKAANGDVVFGAKAWNSEPMVKSEQVVQDLTTLALQKAWNKSVPPLPQQQAHAQPILQQEEISVSAPNLVEMPLPLETSSSDLDHPLPPQEVITKQTPQQEVDLVAASHSAKLDPTSEVSNSELERSLPLQPNIALPTRESKEVSGVFSPSVRMSSILAASKSESDRSLLLQSQVVEQTPQQEEALSALSYSEGEAPMFEASQPEIIDHQIIDEGPSLGLQVASGFMTVLYAPVKIVYAGLGGIMGGLAYLLTAGNEQVAQSIWDASIQGDYWLTTQHLQGAELIHFKGEPSQITVQQARLNEAMAAGATTE